MIIRTDEKSVTLTPFGSLALNGVANVSRDGGQSAGRFLKLIKAVRTSRLAVSLHAWLSQPGS